MANPTPNTPITVASAIHKIQLYLLETPSTPFDLLVAASTLLSKPDYDDVVTERTISDLCGSPLCPNALPSPGDRRRKGKYRVSLSEHKVYDLQETYNYCSEECLIGSRALRGSLSDERRADVNVRKSKVEEVLRLFGYFDGEEGEEEEETRKGAVLGKFKLEIKEKEGVRAGDVKLDEWIGPSNAIEGYIPQLDRGMDSPKGTGGHVKDQGDEALSHEFSTVTNDVSDTIVKKMEDVVITEKKRTDKKSSKSSKLKSQADVIKNSVKKMEYSDVCSTSSIICGNEFDKDIPMNHAVSTQDASELLAKQLEDIVIAEQTSRKLKRSKSPRTTSRRKPGSNKCDKMDFQSTIVIRDSANVAPPETSSVSSLYSTKQSAERTEGDVYPKNETQPIGAGVSENVLCSDKFGWGPEEVAQEIVLKSSLKTSHSKVGNRSVKWADQRNNEALEDKKDTSEVMQEEDSDNSIRFASAEACAAALLCAAEAVASGEAEAGDAVVEAGITILPQPQHGNGRDSEADEEAFEFDRGVLKWPKKTVLLETDMFDVEDSWHDTPPEGFSLTLSTFATMWMVLFGWITCSSLAYVYGHDESLLEHFLVVNGREYPRKVFVRDGRSSEIRQALEGFICRALPVLVMDLRLPTPVSTLEKFVARLLDTMSFVDALPSFKMKQWQVIVLLFMEALSVHRLPSLAQQMTSRTMLVRRVLNAAQVSSEEYETMRDLIMPLGRLPQFSMQCGG